MSTLVFFLQCQQRRNVRHRAFHAVEPLHDDKDSSSTDGESSADLDLRLRAARFSRLFMSLCLKSRTSAPLMRTPNRMEAWLYSSEITRQPLLTSAGDICRIRREAHRADQRVFHPHELGYERFCLVQELSRATFKAVPQAPRCYTG